MTDTITEEPRTRQQIRDDLIRLWAAMLCHVEKLAVVYKNDAGDARVWTSDDYDPTTQDPVRNYAAGHELVIPKATTEEFLNEFWGNEASWTVYAVTHPNYPEQYAGQLIGNIIPTTQTSPELSPSSMLEQQQKTVMRGISELFSENQIQLARPRLFREFYDNHQPEVQSEILYENAAVASISSSRSQQVDRDTIAFCDEFLTDVFPHIRSAWEVRARAEMLPYYLYQRITPIDASLVSRPDRRMRSSLVGCPNGAAAAEAFWKMELNACVKFAFRNPEWLTQREIMIRTGKYRCDKDEGYQYLSSDCQLTPDELNAGMDKIIYLCDRSVLNRTSTEYANNVYGSLTWDTMPEGLRFSRQKLIELHQDDVLAQLGHDLTLR